MASLLYVLLLALAVGGAASDRRAKLVQVTGAGVDRVDADGLRELGIPLANVPGGSNEAIAEYAVSCACVLLRRFTEAGAKIRSGRYGAFRSSFIAENVDGLEGLLVGIVGLGTIGTAVARKFKQLGTWRAFCHVISIILRYERTKPLRNAPFFQNYR